MSTIFFATRTQAAIFELELKGQISDGFWENARPMDHYQEICRADVCVDPENPRSYVGARRKYNFANKELVDIVGERMIFYAKAAAVTPDISVEGLHFVVDFHQDIVAMYETGKPLNPNYTNTIIKYVKEHGIKYKDVKNLLERIVTVEYTEKDLMADLKAIKQVVNR